MKLTDRQMQVLRGLPHAGSEETTWIAHNLGELTHWIASPMKALERKGFIACTKRGEKGLPSKFALTPAGRAALEEQP